MSKPDLEFGVLVNSSKLWKPTGAIAKNGDV